VATRSGGIFSGGGGLLLLVGGLLVKHAEANEVSACSSGLGRLGQAFDPGVASSCSSAQDLSSAANVAMWVGAIIVIGAAASVVFALIGAGAVVAGNKKARPGTAGARPVTRARPPAAGIAPVRAQAAPARPDQRTGRPFDTAAPGPDRASPGPAARPGRHRVSC
jgi:hypothetical protein